MRRLFLRLLPERAAAQIAVIVIGSLILANIVTAIVLLVTLPREFRRLPNFPHVVELVTVARQLHATGSAQDRATVLAAALAANPRLSRLVDGVTATTRELHKFDREMQRGLREELAGVAEVFVLDKHRGADWKGGLPGPPPVGLRFADGTGLVMAPPPMTPPPRGLAFVVYLLVMLASLATLVGLLSLWATRAVVSPLTGLAEAADRFDPDRDEVVAIKRAPVEVKRLAAAFSAMAGRIRRLVDERTRMLAAVSHDLRTPITRLRLRAEDIAEEDKRKAILADLALMERMVGGALSYLREGRASGSMVATDVPALLQTICDDFADLGHIVVYQGPMRASALCDADQMMRAVTNLIDNAIKFGGKVAVRLDDADPERIAVIVEDDGPGIAAEEREKVFEPFYRSDLARTLREGSGFGLGLAIVRSIAEGHRGELTLAERPGGGLRAMIAWPRRW
jgi:signal transduction histidine kinase